MAAAELAPFAGACPAITYCSIQMAELCPKRASGQMVRVTIFRHFRTLGQSCDNQSNPVFSLAFLCSTVLLPQFDMSVMTANVPAA